MSIFTQYTKENDFLEMKDLSQNDHYEIMTKLKFMLQSRILNFDKIYSYLDQEVYLCILKIIQGQNDDKLSQMYALFKFRPLLVKEAENDLDEILNIIKELQNIVLYQKQEQQERAKLINEYKQKLQEYNLKLNRITERLIRVQRKSVENIKSPKNINEQLLNHTKQGYLEEDIVQVDKVRVSLQKQMQATVGITAEQQSTQTPQKQAFSENQAHRRTQVNINCQISSFCDFSYHFYNNCIYAKVFREEPRKRGTLRIKLIFQLFLYQYLHTNNIQKKKKNYSDTGD